MHIHQWEIAVDIVLNMDIFYYSILIRIYWLIHFYVSLIINIEFFIYFILINKLVCSLYISLIIN